MNPSSKLLRIRYIPLLWILVLGALALVLTLLQFRQAEFTNFFSLQDWLHVLFSQPLHGWLCTIFITLLMEFMSQTSIIVSHESITVETFSMVFITCAERQKIEKLQLYSHAKSKKWIFKSLIPHKAHSIEDEWGKSTLGFVLKPAYRKTHVLKHLWLGQVSAADRIQLIQILQQYWGLQPKLILGIDQLSKLMRQHKLR